MERPDFNLLLTLDVLLEEGSVTRAAKRLRLSPSAMSRALARLRERTGDPLLVRAGRGLVPTPRALELRGPVHLLREGVESALRPSALLDLARLDRTFSVRSNDGFVETFGPALIARVAREAPRVRLRFLQKSSKDVAALRDGAVDLETGVVGKRTSPELRAQTLFQDRFIGVIRKGHPLSRGKVTAARYAAGRHVAVSRREDELGPIDEALEPLGLRRDIVAIVGGYSTALALTKASDLIATLPERHTTTLRTGMVSFTLPAPPPPLTVALLWHPRLHADPAHRWLRELVRAACAG